MLLVEHVEGEGWGKPAIVPFGPLSIHPAATVCRCLSPDALACRSVDSHCHTWLMTPLTRPNMRTCFLCFQPFGLSCDRTLIAFIRVYHLTSASCLWHNNVCTGCWSSAQSLHYGMGCFEGMKAYAGSEDGLGRLFRPDMNMARLQRSSQRLMLADFDAEVGIGRRSAVMCSTRARRSTGMAQLQRP